MDKEEIMRMAREAGLAEKYGYVTDLVCIERFAALVAAAERSANIECIGRIAVATIDPINRAGLLKAMDAICARSQS